MQQINNEIIFLHQDNLNILSIFTSCKVKDFFSLKAKVNPFLIANVVYKYSCLNDSDLMYIGETKRHIGIRASEHLDLSKNSAVANHISNCDTCFEKHRTGQLSFRNFEVMKFGRSKFDVEILEAIYIKRLNPGINKQLHRGGSSLLLKVY